MLGRLPREVNGGVTSECSHLLEAHCFLSIALFDRYRLHVLIQIS